MGCIFLAGYRAGIRIGSWEKKQKKTKNELSDVNLRKVVLVKKKIWKNYKKTSGKEENKDMCVGVLLYVCACMCNDKNAWESFDAMWMKVWKNRKGDKRVNMAA